MIIRELHDADTAPVLALNDANVKQLSPLDEYGLTRARERATAIRVAEVDGRVAGFCIIYGPDDDCRSINFRWHRDHFQDFLYLDRVVVDDEVRRQGVASALYDAAEEMAAPHGRLVAEVNYEPPNEASLAFHESRGYAEVGTLTQPSGVVCVMVEKELAAAPQD